MVKFIIIVGTCYGSGYTSTDCSRCRGSGTVQVGTCNGTWVVSGTETGWCPACGKAGPWDHLVCSSCGRGGGAGGSFKCSYCGYTVSDGMEGSRCGASISGDCPNCNGTGFGDDVTCSSCNGSGKSSSYTTCTTCSGSGNVTTTKSCDHPNPTVTHYYCEHGTYTSNMHD